MVLSSSLVLSDHLRSYSCHCSVCPYEAFACTAYSSSLPISNPAFTASLFESMFTCV